MVIDKLPDCQGVGRQLRPPGPVGGRVRSHVVPAGARAEHQATQTTAASVHVHTVRAAEHELVAERGEQQRVAGQVDGARVPGADGTGRDEYRGGPPPRARRPVRSSADAAARTPAGRTAADGEEQ